MKRRTSGVPGSVNSESASGGARAGCLAARVIGVDDGLRAAQPRVARAAAGECNGHHGPR